jgi:hypothetical protein
MRSCYLKGDLDECFDCPNSLDCVSVEEPEREAMKNRFKICVEGELDSMTTLNASFTVVVKPATPPPNPLTLTPNGGNLPDEKVGAVDAGDTVCVVSGGTPFPPKDAAGNPQSPYQFAIAGGQVPPGMTLGSVTNADGSETVSIAGTPTGSGPFSFGLAVTDAAGATVSTTKQIN